MGRRRSWWINEKGEVCVYAPQHPDATRKGYVLEHRLVMERELGRPLLRSETVRHKDGNPRNNAPANLVVVKSGAAYRPTGKTGEWRFTDDVAQGAMRMILAVGRRLAKSDPEELELLLQVQAALDEALRTAITGLLAQGFSESEIGRGLGRTQQWVSKARKRWREDESNGEGRASGWGA
jgi:hypothetical protein